jgi:Zn-dependent peptidase ImmA (M78 family)
MSIETPPAVGLPEEVVLRAERAAIELLRSVGMSGTSVANPFVIAKMLGISVKHVTMPADQSLRLVVGPGVTPVISVNKADSLSRHRFACAHAVGHYLSSARRAPEIYTDTRASLAGIGVPSSEVYANQFAAALVMPAVLVKQYFDKGYSIHEMATCFVTSAQAVRLRLLNLRLSGAV